MPSGYKDVAPLGLARGCVQSTSRSTSLGASAAASLVTLLGAVSGELGSELLVRLVVGAGLLLGVLGVAGLVSGCLNLLRATQLSLMNIREEAALIRARQEQQKNSPENSAN